MHGARPSTRQYVPALDGLRGVAVVAVVAFHLGWLSGGWLGVDAFFTLSGFLITSLLLAEADGAGRVDLRAFWRRRVRRLQPAALVAVLAVVATAPWWAPPGTGASVWHQALAALGSVANWQALWGRQPYAAGTAASAFEHFWSLAIEEQFYVVWPLVVVGLVAWRRRAWVGPVAVLGTLASWAALASHGVQRGYLGTDGRIGSILLGAALAAALSVASPLRTPVGSGAGWNRRGGVAGALAFGAMAGLWVVGGWPPRAPLAVLIPAHALATAVVLVRPPRVLEWRPLVGLGRVSYGVYLWHWPVFVLLTPERLGMGAIATDIVRVALTAACTAASWLLVEHPVRTGRVVRRTRPAWALAAATVVAVAAVGSRGVGPAPAWAKADGRLVTAEPEVAAGGTVGRRVLVVGDSLPTSLMAGDAVASWQVGDDHLLGALTARGMAAAGATVTSCPVVDEVVILKGQGPNLGCRAALDRVLPSAFAGFGPDVVLWYSRQDAYAIRTEAGTVEDPIASAPAAARLRQRYADRLAWFAARGAEVILVSPGPNAAGHDRNDERGDSPRSMAFLDEQLQRVAAEHPDTVTGVVRMQEFTARHPDARGDDGLHFAGDGAAQASAWLARRVAELVS